MIIQTEMYKFSEYSESEEEEEVSMHLPLGKSRVMDTQIQVEHLVCSICHNILWNPVLCAIKDGCHNAFCKQCIAEWIKRSQLKNSQSAASCPTCKKTFIESVVPPVLRSLLKSLTFKCQNTNNGCQDVLQYQKMARHLTKECLYRNKKCQGCHQNLIYKNYLSHTQKCPKFMVRCPKCQTQMSQFEYLNRHFQEKVSNSDRSYSCYQNELQNFSRSIEDLSHKNSDMEDQLDRLQELADKIVQGSSLELLINFHTGFVENFTFPEPTLSKASYNERKGKYDFLHFYVSSPIYLNSVANIKWTLKVKRMLGNVLLGLCSSMGIQSLDIVVNKMGEVKRKRPHESKYKVVNAVGKQEFSFGMGDILKIQYLSVERTIRIENQTKKCSVNIGPEVLQQFQKPEDHDEANISSDKIYAFYSLDTQNDCLSFLR